jgi:hypothetical protein
MGSTPALDRDIGPSSWQYSSALRATRRARDKGNAMTTPLRCALVALLPIAAVAVADAYGAQRTFVSTSGFDTNACSLASPCRGFTKALTVTDPNGEIIALDSGGYGAVVINQPVSIVAPQGVYAGVSVAAGGPTAGQGIVINAGTGDVTLRGLTINNQGGTNGIAFNSGGSLYIDNVVVTGFSSGSGVVAATGSGTSRLVIQDSTFRDNATGLKTGTTTGSLTLTVERTMFERNGKGADIAGNTHGEIHTSTFNAGTTGVAAGLSASGQTAKVELRDCTVSDNSGTGVAAIESGSPTTVIVVSTLVSGNSTGFQVSNGNVGYISDSTITRNATGLSATAGGSIISAGDNRLIQNTIDGTVSSTVLKI